MKSHFIATCLLLSWVSTGIAQDQFFTTRPNAKPQLVPLPKEEGVFHFVIFGDRTGGPVEGIEVLKQAVQDTNLLDPDLVMTVGDLINGYNARPQWMMQMKEYRGAMSKLDMPWFPVAGNHDIYWRGPEKPLGEHERNYEMHFGPLWYAFKHKNAGFVAVYSDEGDPATGEKNFHGANFQNVSPEQLDFLKEALAKLKECDHVFLFLHHPRWLGGANYAGSNWDLVHQLLVEAGNVSAVFGGHIHQMTYAGKKDGIEYFTLAAVGAHLGADLPQAGYLHHINVVTVRKDEFNVATIPVGQVIDPREFTLERIQEIGQLALLSMQRKSEPIKYQPDQPSQHGTYSVSMKNPTSRPIEVTATIEGAENAWRFLPSHQHVTIEPGMSQVLAFRYRSSADAGGFPVISVPELQVDVEYLAATARVPLPTRRIPIDFDYVLPSEPSKIVQSTSGNSVLSLNGSGAMRVLPEEIHLPDGPFTLEAWMNPSSIEGSRGVVAKTERSEYAIFLMDGVLDFSVHLDGQYASASSDQKLAVGRWSHVAGVFTGEAVQLFVDGRLVKETAASGSRTQNELPLYLGADTSKEGEMTRPFAGLLDTVRLSKIARYENSFKPQRHYKADPETVLLYEFDQAYGPFVMSQTPPFVPARAVGEVQLVPEDGPETEE